ncbi:MULTISPECIES: glutamate--tRNA ligase [Hydrocarboniphaga]|jgi:glutamyl-tRNA synthetase|uniref:Glutamate--tRNA ligase n=1 Tax=Hydrocarboniphaga effusa AP103 TaxID=1172194 RepID=I7Z9Y4_9GAMM|nr:MULTISPECIES: glutamate--tRNA ligase [Hydrocarboniphaga]EIT68659.1 glutamyl-tRNA synthetase [Hydrocarboniphaga effusa AP103]MDZ4076822.1 glutamate--tRNA ligase [Hydrocarboniphaga sp.]
MSAVTRFAPSPTGFLHIGGARTALFSYLVAKNLGGKFLLRIEDTDRERSTQEAVDAIFEGMEWLGLKSDFDSVYQTQRFDRYKEVIAQMLAAGTAYYCYATREELDAMRAEQMARKEKPRYDGRWRPEAGKTLPEPPAGVPPVVRFRNPVEGEVVLDDLIKGPIVFANTELDDLIIARADGVPTYNFCVVVDDWDMGITHVIRGDDHVNNTPRQINILKALGAEPPAYAHVSMILGADGAKLSKRHGALGVMEYRAMGFLPEALLNYLVRLGWSHGDQELFTRQEMIEKFDLSKVSSSAARFDMEKAYWVNHQYLKSVDPEVVVPEFEWHLRRMGLDPANGPSLVDVILSQRERCRTLLEMAEKSHFLYADLSGYNEKDAAKHFNADGLHALAGLYKTLKALGTWDAPTLHAAVNGFAEAEKLGLGKVAQPLRVAIVGMAVSPPIDQTLALLGRERTLARLDAAVAWARSRASA